MSALAEGYVYAEEKGAPGAPTLFLFHGTGGDERQFTPLAKTLMPGARLIAPRGDVSEHGAARFFRRRAEGLYDMEDLARRTEAMAGFIAARLTEGDGGKVIGLGYSNGANILASVILARPDLFDAAALLHPLIPWTPAPAPVRTRVLITAGRRDPICPAPMTEDFARYLRDQGAPTALHWHPGGHEIDRSEITAISDFLKTA
jgi:phospholipase/carboxylesterase